MTWTGLLGSRSWAGGGILIHDANSLGMRPVGVMGFAILLKEGQIERDAVLAGVSER